MDHNDIRHKLSEYIDNAVTNGEKAAIEEHLKTCADCADALRELRKTIEHIQTVEAVEPPSWMTQKIMAKVREEAAQKSIFQRLFYPLAIKLPIQTVAVLFLAVTAYYIYMNINPAEKYAETPMEVAAKKEAPALGRIEPGARVAEEAPARRRDVQQAPEYKSLDMKYSYEKPTPPVPQEQQAAAAPKEQAAPLMAKDEADNESQPASPRAKAAAPTRSPEQAGASIGRSAETEAKTRPQAYRERTYREFATSITAFPYKAPAEKRERLLRNYAKLMIGMTKEEIAKLLGDPDHSDMLQTKEPPFEQLGSEWRYYVFLNRSDSVNKKNDQSISVYFSLDGRAHWIVPLNLEGLSAKGSPWRDK